MTSWEKRTWVIRWAGGDGGHYLKQDNSSNQTSGVNEFELVPEIVNGNVRAYCVRHEDQCMTPYWKSCVLFPRGSASLLWEYAQLPRERVTWTQADAASFSSCLSTITANTRRLEGDFKVQGVAEPLALYIIEGAIKGGWPLLVLNLAGDVAQEAGTQSGTATGDPK